jgi:uncharacterized protein
MDITPLVPQGRQIIQAYGDGGFRISGIRHEGSVLVLPERTLPWAAVDAAELTAEAVLALLPTDLAVEIFLLGTGARMAAVMPEMRRRFRQAGIALEVMDTGAACRTYNVLLVEERRVAAALTAVGA